MCDTYHCNYQPHTTIRFLLNQISVKYGLPFPILHFFTVKSLSFTQRSVSQENAFKKSKKPVAFFSSSYSILANFQISERGTNERKKFKTRNIPKFPIHYYTKIAAKTGTHDKIILFFASKRGTVPPKEEQLASML